MNLVVIKGIVAFLSLAIFILFIIIDSLFHKPNISRHLLTALLISGALLLILDIVDGYFNFGIPLPLTIISNLPR